jgi:sialate O-acetylesterase
MRIHIPSAAIALFTLLGTLTTHANVTLPAIFSDHAVLQAGGKTPLWGWADPEEEIKVTLGSVQVQTKAGPDRKWRVDLNLKEANSTPQELVVEGKNKITLVDILVGEVWLCSGQSNMEWRVNGCTGGAEEIAQSANPLLRHFAVTKNTSPTPVEKAGDGKWTVAGPETTGSFTAVGYFFAKRLQKELQVPVAVIHSSWGGTPVESWTSNEGFQGDPVWNQAKEKQLQMVKEFPNTKRQYGVDFDEWLKKTTREDKRLPDQAPFAGTDVAEESWTKVKIPGEISGSGIPKEGTVWIRRVVEVTQELEGNELVVRFGTINSFEEAYWNGEKIWETSYKFFPGNGFSREYKVPKKFLKQGKNVISFRIFSPHQKALVGGTPGQFKVILNKINIGLTGDWFAKAEYEFPALSSADPEAPKVFSSIPLAWNTCTFLYNSMIHPWIPYGIRGVNWYQGESNVGRAVQYKKVLPVMIQDWRTRWNQGDFFFNICQLANYQGKRDLPGESVWAELRDSQTQVSLTVPNVGLANLIDLGEAGDIHPQAKVEVGNRLAFNALAKVYGKQVPITGPLYDSMKVEGDKIRIEFKNTEGGLVAKPLPETYIVKSTTNENAPYVKYSPQSELQGFIICGENRQWVWADAKIENNSVVVSSSKVPNPTAVRYAWSDNPTCNLYNGAGLPAVCFRTDSFPLITEGKNLE